MLSFSVIWSILKIINVHCHNKLNCVYCRLILLEEKFGHFYFVQAKIINGSLILSQRMRTFLKSNILYIPMFPRTLKKITEKKLGAVLGLSSHWFWLKNKISWHSKGSKKEKAGPSNFKCNNYMPLF